MRGAFKVAAAIVLCAAAPTAASAQCTVSGPDSMCAGQSVELCAAEGTSEWTWTGPGGVLLGSSRCISVSAPGTYRVRLFDGDNGLFFTCERTVSVASCDTTPPPPPPPPPSSGPSCPRSAAWWWKQCAASPHPASITAERFASLSACADARSFAIDAKAGAAMCEVLERKGPLGDVRTRALRQFAALQMNLCAREQGMQDGRGGFGLDAAGTTSGLPGVADGTTLSAWASAADAELTALGSRSLRERSVKRAYRKLRVQAFLLNHGRGLARTCSQTASSREVDDEPEASISFEADEAGLVVERITPNPSRGAVRIAWSLPVDAEVELSVVDIAGRTVRELVRGHQAAGSREFVWDGAAADGRPLRSGAYFVRGRVAGESVQARLVLVR